MTSPRLDTVTSPRLDHVGIAVTDLEASLALWRDALGANVTEIEVVEEQGVRVAFLDTGAAKTELLEPLDESSPIARFHTAGKKGVHHLAYRVTDIDGMLASLRESGVALINETAVGGSRGTRVAFLHPRSTGGVLIELVEHGENGEHGKGATA